MVSKCFFGITRQWPSFAECLSMKASVSSFWYSWTHGSSPEIILQKMHVGCGAIHTCQTRGRRGGNPSAVDRK
jgi:hypothetical protein